jgi:adenosine kinase
MNFDGHFKDHLLPEKIHVINVCFTVNGLREMLGGTAGNIAYSLAQLGEKPMVLSTLGSDGKRYLDYLVDMGVDTSRVLPIEQEFTAGAYITTDLSDNQITGFNPGAMKYSCRFELDGLDKKSCLAIIGPGNLEDMAGLPKLLRQHGIPYIFDPGQQLNVIEPDDLLGALTGAYILISNDYELEMIFRMTGLSYEKLMTRVHNLITTKGDKGSVLLTGSGQVEIPAAPADVVKDPTGAGDAFRGGLMRGLALGKELPEACLYGAAIASFAVAHHGTQEYSLKPGQFEERLQKVRQLATANC